MRYLFSTQVEVHKSSWCICRSAGANDSGHGAFYQWCMVADQQKQPTPRPINNKKWIANWTDPYTLYILELHTFNSIHTLFCGKQFTWAWMTRRSIEENVTCFSLCTYRHTLVGCMQGGGGGGIHCYRFRSICGRYIHYLVYHYSL